MLGSKPIESDGEIQEILGIWVVEGKSLRLVVFAEATNSIARDICISVYDSRNKNFIKSFYAIEVLRPGDPPHPFFLSKE